MNQKFKRFCDKKYQDPEYHKEIKPDKLISDITILLGPNGSGKSMSFRSLESYFKNNNIECLTYSNKRNDIVNTCVDFDITKLICAFHSEGERIKDSIYNFSESNFINELLSNEKDIYVLIDELDSGLSIDSLLNIISEYIQVIVLEKHKHPERTVKLVFSCNSYEMLHSFYIALDEVKNDPLYYNYKAYIPEINLIWVPTMEYIYVSSYDAFIKRYMNYRKYMKNKEDK